MRRALISVYNKAGIVDFARGLVELGWKIISTGGTARALKDAGVEVVDISQVTGFPEILDGRVKTLHPKVHGGILARRDVKEHMETLKKVGVETIDMVVVNLYPFRRVVEEGGSFEEIVENIDIGGPTLIRAAAKNFRDVIVVVDPEDYGSVLSFLKEGDVPLEERFKLARKAFYHTATYDAYISNYFHRIDQGGNISSPFPERLVLDLGPSKALRYGENPHQKGLFYGEDPGRFLVQGKELSYNNIMDADAAFSLCLEIEEPACVIVKHTNPCGVAQGNGPLRELFVKARECDPVSAFGGIIAFNREVDGDTAQEIIKDFYEVVVAPGFSEKAKKTFSKKKDLRVLELGDWRPEPSFLVRSALGGYLIQDPDLQLFAKLEVVTKEKPTDEDMKQLLFGYRIVKHVKSNAVVFVKDGKLLGVGAGQMSRVDSVKIAMEKSREPLNGSYLASDAFFPFPDSIELAAKAGIKGVIQPGGSLRDQEVIDACNRYGLFMVFTGMRHFKH